MKSKETSIAEGDAIAVACFTFSILLATLHHVAALTRPMLTMIPL